MRNLFVSCFFGFFLTTIIAQIKQNDSITRLDEVIVFDDPLVKSAIGITPSSTVGLATISKFSPIDASSAINQIAGVYMLSGALNTNRITIRGVGARTPFGTDKLRLYFNGIPVTNGTGFSTIEAYDLENIGSIEVIKGPKGTSYGTNLGGAIVLHTKMPLIEESKITNDFTIGSYGLLKDNLTFQHSEKKFNLNVSYNHLETNGYRQNNQFERDGLLLNLQTKINQKSTLALLFNHIDYTAQIPSSLNLTDFEEDPTRAASNWLEAQGFEANKYSLAGLSFSQLFNSRFSQTTSLFYSYLDHYEPRPFNILDEFTNGFGIRSVFKGKMHNGEFALGLELYKDEYNWSTFGNLYQSNNGNGSLQGDQLSRNKEFRRQANFFGTYNYTIHKKLRAQLGLNLNKTQYDFRDLFNSADSNRSAERNFKAILLPSLGMQYEIGNGYIYANIGRGFSNPGLEETLTPDGVINPDITQETGVSYELGMQWMGLKKRLQLSASIYRMNIKNLLVAQRVGEDQFIGKNAGQTKHQGLEINMKYFAKMSKNLRFSPFLSYTLNDHSFVDFIDGDDVFSGNPLTGVPKHRISLGIDLQHTKGWQVHLTHQFVDEIPLTDANTLNSESFNVFGGKASYQIGLGRALRANLNLGVNNIFATNYAQSVLINAVGFGGAQPRYYYPGNGRNYFGGLQLRYSF
ncbi:MAG: TonB-dependent receptor [Croceitalea sp.]|nr:TonB-dependent receptor [Croceitalea sp.]NNL10075.1 TonB-dependent receptor [Croceitalea sp.]